MSANTYTKDGEWSSYTVTESAKGYVVTFDSRIQGELDGYRALVRFGKDIVPGMQLDGKWNDCTDNAEAIMNRARECPDKVLCRGSEVQ